MACEMHAYIYILLIIYTINLFEDRDREIIKGKEMY